MAGRRGGVDLRALTGEHPQTHTGIVTLTGCRGTKPPYRVLRPQVLVFRRAEVAEAESLLPRLKKADEHWSARSRLVDRARPTGGVSFPRAKRPFSSVVVPSSFFR